MSFTDQKRWVASEEDCARSWGLDGKGFRCGLCGHRFKAGDGVRWVYMASSAGLSIDGVRFGTCNFKVCDTCDGDDVRERWIARHEEFYSDKFWALR